MTRYTSTELDLLNFAYIIRNIDGVDYLIDPLEHKLALIFPFLGWVFTYTLYKIDEETKLILWEKVSSTRAVRIAQRLGHPLGSRTVENQKNNFGFSSLLGIIIIGNLVIRLALPNFGMPRLMSGGLNVITLAFIFFGTLIIYSQIKRATGKLIVVQSTVRARLLPENRVLIGLIVLIVAILISVTIFITSISFRYGNFLLIFVVGFCSIALIGIAQSIFNLNPLEIYLK